MFTGLDLKPLVDILEELHDLQSAGYAHLNVEICRFGLLNGFGHIIDLGVPDQSQTSLSLEATQVTTR